MKTIGLIGGMSWESTVPYYRIINETVKDQIGGLHSAKILLCSVDFAEIEACQSSGEWDKSADILVQAAQSLEAAGADFILICSNTMHKIVPQIEARITAPILHIADATIASLKANHVAKVALLGTKYTMMQAFYKERIRQSGIEVLIPSEADIELVNRVIYNELCLGNIQDTSRQAYIRVIDSLKQRDAEGVILGCTEIGSLISQEDSPLPVFDTTYIHARAAAMRALEQANTREYAYKKVDAFTSGASLGNPAAFLMLGNDTLTLEEMLQVGREHAGFVSEVVFCSHSSIADTKLTYYSSECEVAFCGHGTIATMYEMIRCSASLRQKPEVSIETNQKGVLTVYNALDTEGCIYITAPEGVVLPLPVTSQEAAAALGTKTSAAHPLGFIDAGLHTLIVPIVDLQEEITLLPDQEALRQFCVSHSIDIILTFCMDTGSPAIAHTRVFAPRFGYLEDPVTGSGNSAFGYYMLQHDLWKGEAISIQQGGKDIAFNQVRLKCLNGRVLFGGKATLRIEGTYCIR